ncbi:hypothetical protein IWQ60_009695 [Tieghemiomyces parasiticus]|uniref:HCP-like protein n=1 Tax=Tieghemiomyces parasiticus TaxID=78921 RepID=A0A9W7ZWT8_9FUNG|nr:hypothetical protein IWQ60_009695 [Tieghemiomyces parasiticus]
MVQNHLYGQPDVYPENAGLDDKGEPSRYATFESSRRGPPSTDNNPGLQHKASRGSLPQPGYGRSHPLPQPPPVARAASATASGHYAPPPSAHVVGRSYDSPQRSPVSPTGPLSPASQAYPGYSQPPLTGPSAFATPAVRGGHNHRSRTNNQRILPPPITASQLPSASASQPPSQHPYSAGVGESSSHSRDLSQYTDAGQAPYDFQTPLSADPTVSHLSHHYPSADPPLARVHSQPGPLAHTAQQPPHRSATAGSDPERSQPPLESRPSIGEYSDYLDSYYDSADVYHDISDYSPTTDIHPTAAHSNLSSHQIPSAHQLHQGPSDPSQPSRDSSSDQYPGEYEPAHGSRLGYDHEQAGQYRQQQQHSPSEYAPADDRAYDPHGPGNQRSHHNSLPTPTEQHPDSLMQRSTSQGQIAHSYDPHTGEARDGYGTPFHPPGPPQGYTQPPQAAFNQGGPPRPGHPASMYSDGNYPGSSTASATGYRRPPSPPPATLAIIDSLREKANQSSDPKVQLEFVQYAVRFGDQAITNEVSPVETERVKQNLRAEALKLLKKLATQGGFGRGCYADAQFVLADCYNKGHLDLAPDHDKAFNLYQQSSKQSHAQGTYRTAVCYEMGAGTKRDPHRAVQYYRKAAALGDTGAMYKLGVVMLKGLLSQPINTREGVTWLKRAADNADHENPHALHELALCYEKGGVQSIIVDEHYAKELYTQAAQLGYEPSQFKLGFCYEYGTLTCPQDPRRSIAWYTRAAEQGDAEAELALSGWYLTGSEGILQQSDTEAYLWARKAADKGLAKAEYAIGYYTETGIGVKQDLEEARRWYMRSAAQGHKRAMNRLTELKRMGSVSGERRKHNRNGKGDDNCVIF